MDSRAAAPAATAAAHHGVGTARVASLFTLFLLLLTATAIADSMPAQGVGDSNRIAEGAAAQFTSSGTPLANLRISAALATAPGSVVPQTGTNVPRPRPTGGNRHVAAIATEKNAQAPKPTVIFGALGRPVGLSPITRRWQRATAELAAGSTASRNAGQSHPAYDEILQAARPLRRGLQIPKVNELVNRLISYREDSVLYEKAEYWASPAETLSHRAGDCEDFAILKLALLRDLGVSDDDMRIVVLRDASVRQFHAVLTVRHKGKWLVLDNRFSRVRFERDLPHYKPLYSVNAAGEWAHIREPGSPVRLAARLKAATR